MDQREDQKQQQSLFIKSQFHIKLAQLLLSVSVFSLFFSHSYWLSLLHPFNFTFHDTLPFQLFSHNIDKNCIFLLCNLLVFLAKYSRLISSSSKYNLNDEYQSFKSYEDVQRSESTILGTKAPLLQKEVALESTAEALKNIKVMEGIREEEEELAAAEREMGNFNLEVEEEEEEDGENASFVEEHEEELKGSVNDLLVQDFKETENYEPEGELELVEGNRVLSTEELNKRFDEFIRKMKEELRIEAQQQLIMV